MYFTRPTLVARRIYRNATWRVPTKKETIYLTFDDGPVPEITPWILETLRKYKAKATFFCVGNNVLQYPDIFGQIINENHSVGNHTYNHLNGWKVKTNEYLENIEQCNTLIESKLFRPPYGRMKAAQYSALSTRYSVIMWDVLSGDFDPGISGEKCLHNTIKKTRKGSVVVFHDNVKAKKNLFYVLPKFMEYFDKQGFTFDNL